MTHVLTKHERAVLAEIEEDKKALRRELVMLRIERRRQQEEARKNGEYTQERLEADARALKAVQRWLRRRKNKSVNQKQRD